MWKYISREPANIEERIIVSALFAFFSILLSCGPLLLGINTPDDHATSDVSLPAAFFFGQGRFIAAVQSEILLYLGVKLPDISFMADLFLFSSLSILVALLFSSFTSPRTPLIFTAMVAAVAVSHPFLGTFFVYRVSALNIAFCFSFIAGAIYCHKHYIESGSPSHFLLTVVLLTLSFGCYQTILPLAAMWTLYAAICSENNTLTTRITRSFLPIVCALVSYLVLYVLTKDTDGGGWDSRASLISARDIPTRLFEVLNLLPTLIWKGWYALPPVLAKLICATLLFCTVVGTFVSARTTVTALGFAGASLAGVLLPVAILATWAPDTRNLYSFAFIFCFVLVIIEPTLRGVLGKVTALLLAICLSSIIATNGYLAHINRADKTNLWIAGQIFLDLNKAQALDKTISFVDSRGDGGMPSWSFRGLVYNATGRRLNIVNPANADVEKCATAPKWPESGYLNVADPHTVVCL
ncbi:glucosyltransferase domain-containing protein [Phyllobacterium sp. 21LDTY02-6]|uniref:glucosyltransferase domain-containing protein n=1 Tax=Phyllobacterium sp. 21LDTY02-6 TaxID=2944903 RepID=UPI00202216DA|nr:glucosyltransferase domain-containing protein [Phyllobacterium sp. 21LDTY02-6]MCO4316421.1 glucosyltransferase domain-containing protein [Phyllobacterium sp. 21LDTY02-6]